MQIVYFGVALEHGWDVESVHKGDYNAWKSWKCLIIDMQTPEWWRFPMTTCSPNGVHWIPWTFKHQFRCRNHISKRFIEKVAWHLCSVIDGGYLWKLNSSNCLGTIWIIYDIPTNNHHTQSKEEHKIQITIYLSLFSQICVFWDWNGNCFEFYHKNKSIYVFGM